MNWVYLLISVSAFGLAILNSALALANESTLSWIVGGLWAFSGVANLATFIIKQRHKEA